MPQAPAPTPAPGHDQTPASDTDSRDPSASESPAQEAATPEGPGKEPPTPVAPTASPDDAALVPGTRVEVTQQVPRQNRTFHAKTAGVVVKHDQRKTGSWYAHAKDDKLWLDRLTVRKDDGEIVVFILDALTHVEVVEERD